MNYAPPKQFRLNIKKRHPIEMLRQFLSGLKVEEKKRTYTILDCGLNYSKGVKIIEKLVENNLIYERTYMTTGRRKTERKVYGITEKGYEFLCELEGVLEVTDKILSGPKESAKK